MKNVEYANTPAGRLMMSLFGFRLAMPIVRKPKFSELASLSSGINRWTGKPHEHKREIARRKRQRGIAA